MTFKSARSLCVAAGLALAPALAAAQQPEPVLLLLRSNPHAPLSVDAERVSVWDGESAAVFEGNVQVTGPNLTLRCSRLLIRYPKGYPKAPDDRSLIYLGCQP